MTTQYQPRIVDHELDELMRGVSAIAIQGPKAIGKTETALRRAATVRRLDDPAELDLWRAQPSRLVEADGPILIDEWQRYPESWDLVRRAVDDGAPSGRFLLTGSAIPVEDPTHSGAGRIVTVRMRPLALAERGLGVPTVSLRELLSGQRQPVSGGTSVTLADYADEVVNSGFPALRGQSGRVLRAQLDGYLDRIVERDFVEQGHRVRNQAMLRAWMSAYAAASSTTTTYERIRDAASSGHNDKPAKSTTMPYRNTLEQLWMLDPVPAWVPSRNRLSRLGSSPVHQLADPALAARLLGVGTDALLDGMPAGPVVPRDGTLLGALFESLVTLSIKVYAQHNEARVGHLRTRSGDREVDLVVERSDGRVVAFEVKMGPTPRPGDERHLRWLADRIGDDLLDAVIVTSGSEAYRRPDGIAVVPAALLTI